MMRVSRSRLSINLELVEHLRLSICLIATWRPVSLSTARKTCAKVPLGVCQVGKVSRKIVPAELLEDLVVVADRLVRVSERSDRQGAYAADSGRG